MGSTIVRINLRQDEFDEEAIIAAIEQDFGQNDVLVIITFWIGISTRRKQRETRFRNWTMTSTTQ
jgi:predicted nucleotide-binding protein (sugar kinase/HSP70/actin superfamily)